MEVMLQSCGITYDCHTDSSRDAIYDRNIFIIQAIDVTTCAKFVEHLKLYLDWQKLLVKTSATARHDFI